MNGHQPNAVVAHLLNVIELCGYTVEITDTIVVGIVEGVDEDLIPVAIVIINDVKCYLILFPILIVGLTSAQGKSCEKKSEQKKHRKNLFHRFLLIP